MNDPSCRAADLPGHLCTDKFGELWDRPGAGPRPGTTCFFEEVRRLREARGEPFPDFAAARRIVEAAKR